jgi:hypothetical protein
MTLRINLSTRAQPATFFAAIRARKPNIERRERPIRRGMLQRLSLVPEGVIQSGTS